MTKKNSYIQKIEQQNADYLKQIDQYVFFFIHANDWK